MLLLRRELIQKLDETPHAKACFEEALSIFNAGDKHSAVERAWALFVSFCCAVMTNPSINRFNCSDERNLALRFRQKAFLLRHTDIGTLLDNTQIYQGDALPLISLAKELSFMYVDPPYINTEQGHYISYTEADYEALLKALEVTPAKFMLSSFCNALLNSYTERNSWHTFEIDQSRRPVTGPSSRKVEVLTMNYQLTQRNLF